MDQSISELKPESIGVQFSGKPTVYHYVIHPEDAVQVGWRVVVPTGLKNDGTLAMSIATCVERSEECNEAAVLAVIQSIDPVHVNYAVELLKSAEAAKAKGAAA